MAACRWGPYRACKAGGRGGNEGLGCRYLILRTAWLYSGIAEQLSEIDAAADLGRETLRVVFDQVGTPTYAGDLALAIFSLMRAGATRQRGVCTTSPTRRVVVRLRGGNRRGRQAMTRARIIPLPHVGIPTRPPARPTRCWTRPASRRPSKWISRTGGRP